MKHLRQQRQPMNRKSKIHYALCSLLPLHKYCVRLISLLLLLLWHVCLVTYSVHYSIIVHYFADGLKAMACNLSVFHCHCESVISDTVCVEQTGISDRIFYIQSSKYVAACTVWWLLVAIGYFFILFCYVWCFLCFLLIHTWCCRRRFRVTTQIKWLFQNDLFAIYVHRKLQPWIVWISFHETLTFTLIVKARLYTRSFHQFREKNNMSDILLLFLSPNRWKILGLLPCIDDQRKSQSLLKWNSVNTIEIRWA